MKVDKFTPPHPLNTAILFLVFNRLDTTKKIFEAIRQAKPPRLYVAADGARVNVEGDVEKVQAVRNYVMQNIDWDCEVKTLLRDENLGCKYANSSSITWFFENEEKGIILEDDCLPNQSFFWFCEELLERYEKDLRVWHISGNNFQNGIERSNKSYYFSKFPHIWGWASWANRWRHFDAEMNSFSQFKNEGLITSLFSEIKDQRYWLDIFDSVYKKEFNTSWDYQWVYTILSNNGLSIAPNKNLVSNIGFGSRSTHTHDTNHLHANIPSKEIIIPLVHPKFVLFNSRADSYETSKGNLISRIINKIARMTIGKNIIK
tara:strand:+ start:741 stop:1691 length:951 start_codon:yes stop_codon:yes gene_type:complete